MKTVLLCFLLIIHLDMEQPEFRGDGDARRFCRANFKEPDP